MQYYSDLKWLQNFLHVITVLFFAVLVLKILRFFLHRYLKSATEKLKVDPTQYHFLVNGLNFLGYLAAVIIILYGIPGLKQVGVSLFAGAGVFAAVIGFASQTVFSNMISGISLVITKPFRVGDMLHVKSNYYGRVEDITLRHTVLRNIENQRFIVPNSVISSEVILNSSIVDERLNNLIDIAINHGTDIGKVLAMMVEEAMKNPLLIDPRTDAQKENGDPVVIARVHEITDSAIVLRAQCWTRSYSDSIVFRATVYRDIAERFASEGIEPPHAVRRIIMNSDGKIS